MKEYKLKTGEKITAIPFGKIKAHIGDTNNQLTICDRAENGSSKKTRVICKCSCGNYTVVNLQDFKNGQVKSCGCARKEQARVNGINSAIDYSVSERNINPFYEFIQPTLKRNNGRQVIWEIKCRKCGKKFYDVPMELVGSRRHRGNNPCACWKKQSAGLQNIIEILRQHDIDYVLEKTFSTCVSPLGNLLRFDIFLPEYNTCIEYNGEQHYKIAFGQTEEKLILQQKYDKIKIDWCEQNNITLITIPYYQTKITINDLIKEYKQ